MKPLRLAGLPARGVIARVDGVPALWMLITLVSAIAVFVDEHIAFRGL